MIPDPLRYFRVEARDLVQQLGQAVLAIEKGSPEGEAVARALRLAHTLKGAARVVRQNALAQLAHALEDLLAPLRGSSAPAARAPIDAMLANLDAMVARAAALGSAPGPSAPAGATALTEAIPAWAPQAEALAVLDGLREASVESRNLRQALELLAPVRRLSSGLVDHLSRDREAHEATQRLGERLSPIAQELSSAVRALEHRMSGGIERLERELEQVRETAEQQSLVMASSCFPTFERVVRDVGQATGRRVEFVGRGGDVRLEAAVLSPLTAALVQLLRNAVAHGIEAESARVAAGKPQGGTIWCEVERRAGRVRFRCRDDGQGIDLERVRQVAVQRGLLAVGPGQRAADPAQLFALLLQGGVSTSSRVTEVSGRGVGLDLVREAVARLRGVVSVETHPGRGTTIDIEVPVSVSLVPVLTVIDGGARASIPLEAVRGTRRVEAREIVRSGGREVVVHDGGTLPFVPLARALRRPGRGASVSSAVLIESGGGLVAVGVERVLSTASVVVRSLPELTPADAVIAGANLDGAGTPQLVLDPEGLAAVARQEVAESSTSAVPRLPILIIDDSLTTRMLERSILESAGYQVELASSAEEGLEKAREHAYGLFLVDVEMPGMDGFAFVQRTREDPALRRTPAILVTSRNTPDDRQRGAEMGASDYIVKSEFDQARFLASVRKLVS